MLKLNDDKYYLAKNALKRVIMLDNVKFSGYQPSITDLETVPKNG